MLHSTFWNHGAGDLELPSWAVSMFPMPTDLPLKSGNDKNGGTNERRSRSEQQGQQHGHGMADGVFLDFLYPQQALALLHKRSVQQSQRWEKRNARRLPDGFIVASRGYASRSRTANPRRVSRSRQIPEAGEEDDEYSFAEESTKNKQADEDEGQEEWWQQSTASDPLAEAEYKEDGLADFADSPMDLAEPSPEAVRKLRNIMSFNRRKEENLGKASRLTEQAWHLYGMIDTGADGDGRLKTELLSWLNVQRTESSDTYCAELYHAIPAAQRTLQVYEIALLVFLRRDQQLSVSKLHREALQNVDNGHQISKMLFRHAIDKEDWRLAIRTEKRHAEQFGDSSQMKLFWIQVSEIPQLLSSAMKLARSLKPVIANRKTDSHTSAFCATFFKEAINQELLQNDDSLFTLSSVSKQAAPTGRIRDLFAMLARWQGDSTKLFEATLTSLVEPNARLPYPRIHHLASGIFNLYRTLPGALPSEHLLTLLLQQVTNHAETLRKDQESQRSLSVYAVVRHWRRYHGRLSKEAHAKLLAYYARSGNVELHNTAMQSLKEEYPEPSDWKNTLWTPIYLYARKADLDGAQQAFAAVKRELGEIGEEPDLQCWNTLLHAHSRADDLPGALTNLQNLISYARLTPDGYSFHALTEMFAKRGDVDGVEDMLEQYDRLSQAPRSTALLGSLITALARSDDVETAEKVLSDTVEKVKNHEISGSLTKCYNIVLTTYATNRDLDSTKRIYRSMRENGIRLDKDSYAALVHALVIRRQIDAAYKIVTSAMKENGVQPTAFHYSIVMAGYNNAGRTNDTLRVHEDMVRLNIKPTPSSRAAYLEARAVQEHRAVRTGFGSRNKERKPLNDAIEELKRLVETPGPSGIESKNPQRFLRSSSLGDAELASQFDFLIFLHGKRRCFEAVQQLYAQYRERAAERGSDKDAPPIRLLTALMSAYWRAGEYDDVEASWKLAKERADAISPAIAVPLLGKPGQPPVAPTQRIQTGIDPDALDLKPVPNEVDEESSEDVDSTNLGLPATSSKPKPNQPLLAPSSRVSFTLTPTPAPGRRHILTRPLRYYLAALHAQNRLRDLITTVSSLLTQGYRLDNRTFNYFIECLCRASPPLALLAFTLTERFLMPNFPGWIYANYGEVYAKRPQAKAEGLQNLKARYLKPGLLMPQYRTMVRLGSVLLDVRRLEAMGRSSRRKRKGGEEHAREDELERYVGTMAQIRKRAPKTLFAVQSMPKRTDRLQSRLLRREV